jgi:hypothetical protein
LRKFLTNEKSAGFTNFCLEFANRTTRVLVSVVKVFKKKKKMLHGLLLKNFELKKILFRIKNKLKFFILLNKFLEAFGLIQNNISINFLGVTRTII